MTRRFLFGPVTETFAQEHLFAQREQGRCLTFHPSGEADLQLTEEDCWESLVQKLPEGWQPDFLVLYLAYNAIPFWLWTVPIPIIGLAGDWNLLYHNYRLVLKQCDWVLTDPKGVDGFRQEGIEPVGPAHLYGCQKSNLEYDWPQVERDIDILYVGFLNLAIHRERLPWLARLAYLDQRRVVIERGVFDNDYRQLLARSKIVFNRTIRQECNHRVWEAVAAGSLLFVEAENVEVPQYLEPGKEYIAFGSDDLERLLEYYLEHDEERNRIAQAARAKLARFSFGAFWEVTLHEIENGWAELQSRSQQRQKPSREESLLARTWQVLFGPSDAGFRLSRDLEATLAETTCPALVHHALGIVAAHQGGIKGELTPAQLKEITGHFRSAIEADPYHFLGRLNLAEALLRSGFQAEAAAEAQKLLEDLTSKEAENPLCWQLPHFPIAFDVFRVEWERAAWENPGNPVQEIEAKKTLLRWRSHLLLGDLSGEILHFEEATRLRPDLAPGWIALGCALGRAGRPADALAPLRQAVALDPFDNVAARALYQVLGELDQRADQEQLARQRLLLARAAPKLVAVEPWFRPTLSTTKVRTLAQVDFHREFGKVDTTRAVCGFTPACDTQAILTLLAQARPRRILEIGTAAGHMTANLTEWSPDEAQVFTLGVVDDLAVPTGPAQRYEDPPRAAFGRHSNHFGKAHKVFFITADSSRYDFARLAPLDFVFIDGAHDFQHVYSDSMQAYQALREGGLLVWHDFGSPTPWVQVRQAVERLPLAEPVYHIAGTEVAFLCKGEKSSLPDTIPLPAQAEPEKQKGPLAMVWEGAQQAVHSLALVNQAFCRGLVARGHELSIVPDVRDLPDQPLPAELKDLLHRPLSRPAEIHVRQQWPPRLDPPLQGRWVFIQPWEFGSLPRAWVKPIVEQVDEVWAHTRYVQQLYVQAGVPSERVHLVPLGVDTGRFHPDQPPYPLQTNKSFRFLFVGGTIFRKGIDVLLDAYNSAFRRSDDVCLVIKDMGVGTFYQGQTAEERIRQLQADPQAPEIEYLDGSLSGEELAGLYTACHCLVHPYRGEGFGLPIAEAMASGLAVIVTGLGAALDFCDESHAYLIPARKQYFAEKRLGDLETVDYPWLADPDKSALGKLLRHVVAHPEEARAKGKAACAHIRQHFTWEQAVSAAEQRLLELRQQPIRRQSLTTHRKPASVTLCLIARNEEQRLPACLASVAGLFAEMVVVDTGSTDRTKEMAQQFGAKVVDFTWVDSFSAARNESLRQATGEWIFWMDADETFDEINREKLRRLLANLPKRNIAFIMRQSSPLENSEHAVVYVDQVRLFRNLSGLRWQYRAHEQILPSLRGLGAEVATTDIVIQHWGFAHAPVQGAKVNRNLRLLEMDLAEHPDDAFLLYNVGSARMGQGDLDGAMHLFKASLDRSHPQDTLVPKLMALLVRIHHQKGEKDLALHVCGRARAMFPRDGELLFWQALLCKEQGDRAGCERCLLEILSLPAGVQFASADAGLFGYRTRGLLAEVYLEQSRTAEAEAQWRHAVQECPAFTPGWHQLARLWLEQGRWPELEQALGHLRRDPQLQLEVQLLEGRALLAKKEFAQARTHLEQSLGSFPQSLPLRVLLSHVLLQENRDPEAAEKALRSILELKPDHAEARHNLQLLLSQKRSPVLVETQVQPAVHINGTPAASGTQSVCLVMMVKNEEANLPGCLDSVADLPLNIVIIDTGSTDRTKEIALSYGAKVIDFPWVDSFSAARNEGLRHATGDWIFWMDADDRLDEENREKLRRLFAQLDDRLAGFVMKCVCLPDPVTQRATQVDHVRLFRNHPQLRWRYRVHEQILPALNQLGAKILWSDVVIHHTGYQDPALRGRKLQRDLRLLHLELAEQPEDAFTLFNLGSVYREQGLLAEAIPLFRRSLDHSAPGDSIVRKLYVLLAQCFRQLGQVDQALDYIRQGRQLYPSDLELLNQQGVALSEQGDVEGAIASWQAVLTIDPGQHFASVDVGLRGYLTHHNLAVAYNRLGQLDQAEQHWRMALAEKPDYEPALLGVAEACLRTQRWPELEERLQTLESLPSLKLDTSVLRARIHLAQREFAQARQLLEGIIAEHPRVVWPRVILTHVLLQEGQNWEQAEKALRAVLALDPGQNEARQNLMLLLGQLGKPVDDFLKDESTLAKLFRAACSNPSDLKEHCGTLYELARQCRIITVLGTHTGTAATVFLYARPAKLVCYDPEKCPAVERLQALAGGTGFVFHQADVLRAEIEETDLLFLDTPNEFEQHREELRRHAGKVVKYLVLHGTTTFAKQGEDEENKGVWSAEEELMAQGSFQLKERFLHNNDLTILERIS